MAEFRIGFSDAVRGLDGKDGKDGRDGIDGRDGVSCTHEWNGTVLTINSANGSSSADLKGEKGERGEKGEKGDVGNVDLTDYVTKDGFKTINGESIVGDGDIVIEGGTDVDLTNYVTKDGLKTINGESILGNGDIVIEGGESVSSKVVDLVMFMGQSNMAGRGVANQAPVVPEGHGYEFRAMSDPTKLYPIVEPFGVNENNSSSGVNESSKTGSMVSAFVEEYYKYTGVPIVGVSCSKGGTSTTVWLPNGKALNDAINRHNTAKEWLESNGYTVRRDFMVWCQGETDGDNSMSATVWETNMNNIISSMMSDAGVECCMVVRIGNHRDEPSLYDNIIRATNSLCKNNEYAVMVSTILTTFASAGLMKDVFHYTQEGYNLVGADAGKHSAYYINSGIKPYMYDSEFDSLYFPQGEAGEGSTTNSIEVDAEINNESENPVQNKVIANALEKIENENLTVIDGRVATLMELINELDKRIVFMENNANVVRYVVEYNLTNTESSSALSSVAENGSYTTTLKGKRGYQLSSVLVNMGGVDVTADVYVDGVVTISNVIGDVIITAVSDVNSDSSVLMEFTFDAETENGVNLGTAGSVSDGKIYVNKSSVELNEPVTLSPDSSFTFEAIVTPDVTSSANPSSTGVIMANGVNTGGFINLPWESNDTFQIRDEKKTMTARFSSSGCYEKTHYAIVYDADAKTFTGYVNGVASTTSYPNGSVSTFVAFDINHILGGYSANDIDYGYVGDVHYLRITSEALTPDKFHTE